MPGTGMTLRRADARENRTCRLRVDAAREPALQALKATACAWFRLAAGQS
jgi:hypothetical protein